MRRPGILLAGCIFATLFLLGGALLPFGWAYVMATIAIWIGYGTRIKGLTLTAAILYLLMTFSVMPGSIFVLVPTILAFAGYGQQKEIERVEASRRRKRAREQQRPNQQIIFVDARNMQPEDLSRATRAMIEVPALDEPSQVQPIDNDDSDDDDDEEDY